MNKNKNFEKHLTAYYNKIISELKRGTPIQKICKKLSANINMIKDIAKENNINITKNLYQEKAKMIVEEKKMQKLKLAENIKELLLTKEYNYIGVAKKLKTTIHKVTKVANDNKIDLIGEKKKIYEEIVNNLYKDYYSGMPYELIHEKYNLSDKENTIKLRSHGMGALYRLFKNYRNNKILNEYKSGKKAIQIINSNNPVIKNPKRLNTLSSIYHTCSSLGYKKYPNIGRRIDGGTFEKIDVKDEREIFNILGIEYVEPEKREEFNQI